MSVVEDGDRDLMRRYLDAMSAKIKGQSALAQPTAADLVPTAPFATRQPVDIPMAPGEVPIDDPMDPATEEKPKSSYAWGGYQNGRIPKDALAEVGQGSHRLESEAAKAWMAMREAAKADGIDLSLTDSYRTYQSQVRLREEKGDVVATATPGTSVHGWGRAVDANVRDNRTLQWLNENGPKYGWLWPDWAQQDGKNFEPWHREFVGVR